MIPMIQTVTGEPGMAEEPQWQVTVRVPMRLTPERHDGLFTAVADAVAQWEPDERDGWDADVSGCREDETLEAAYESVVKALRRKVDFQRLIVDGVGLLPGEHLDEFAERIVRELQSWRCGARWHSLPRVESVPDATATAAVLARESWDDEADHGELMRSAARKLAAINEAASLLLAERDVLRWLHAEAVHRVAEIEAKVERWKRAWQDADREWAADRAELARERSSRQAWAAEAEQLQADLDEIMRPAIWDLPHAYRNNGGGGHGTPGDCRTCGRPDFDDLHEPPEPPKITVCACISDDQAAALGPGFTRPVCAVHPEVK